MPFVKVAVIGAGPAGIYTTLLLNRFEGDVHLFEQNRDVGEKLKTTGGGRMNVTNKVFTDNEFSSYENRFVERLFKNPHFENRFYILEKLGIEYSWEKNRAILKSQDAVLEVARLKEKLLKQENASLHLNTKITGIKKSESGFLVSYSGGTEKFDRVVLTVGGMYRMFDLHEKDQIYQLSKDLGHSITDICPSLCPLLFTDKALRPFSGISFVGRLTDTKTGKCIEDDLLLTHFGVSGPAALDFSALNAERVELCFVTGISEKDFIAEFNLARQGKHSLKKFLKKYLPGRLVTFHLERSGISQDFIADLPKQKLQDLVKSLFHYPIPARRKNLYPASWTTKGGVSLQDVQTKNLESKKVPGLYFAGEVLDFNGLCGGYNISFAMISAQIVVDDLFRS